MGVSAVLWDLFDSGGTDADGDPFTLGFGPFWTVFSTDITTNQYKSLHTYLDFFVSRGFTTDVALNGAFGPGGTHDTDVPRPPADPSPPFPLAIISFGSSVVDTVDATQGENSATAGGQRLADAMKFYGFDTGPTARSVTITLTVAPPSPGLDLDLYVEDTERNLIAFGFSPNSNETITQTFPAGKYLVYVWAFDGTGTSVSFNLSVN